MFGGWIQLLRELIRDMRAQQREEVEYLRTRVQELEARILTMRFNGFEPGANDPMFRAQSSSVHAQNGTINGESPQQARIRDAIGSRLKPGSLAYQDMLLEKLDDLERGADIDALVAEILEGTDTMRIP